MDKVVTQKMFGIKVNTLIGKASDNVVSMDEDGGGPRISHEDSYEHLDRVCARTANAIMNRIPDETRQDAIDENENGSVKIWMEIHAGSKNYHDCYIKMTDDGYYLYPDAAAMDSDDRDKTMFVDTARDAVNLHAVTVIANEERRVARDNFVNEFAKEERLERDRLKRLSKKEDVGEPLKEAQAALDAKRELAYQEQTYKDLLVPGPLESITTMPENAVTKFKKYGLEVYDIVKNDLKTDENRQEPDKFIPRQIWVSEDAGPLYKHQMDGGSLYMIEEPVNNMASVSPDHSTDIDIKCPPMRIPMDYIRQEVRIKEGHDPLFTPKMKQHVENGGKLYAMGAQENGVMFVTTENIATNNVTPAQYVLADHIEFVDISMAEQDFADAVASIPESGQEMKQ